MSLNSETNRNDYKGNDSVAFYPYTFKILANDHIAVTIKDLSDVEVTLVEATDYTVSGALSVSGGNIGLVNSGQDWLTAGGELKENYKITFIRNLPLTQETDIRNQGDFYAETHEDAFDYSRMVDQQQQGELDRSVKLPVSLPITDFDATLPADLATADTVIAVNPAADGFVVGPTITDVANASANATAAAASAVAAAASAVDADNASSGNMTVDNFNGDASTVLFTLSLAPASENNTDIYIGGVYQQKDTYSILGTALTFSVAPPIGTSNVEVMIGSTLSLSAPADASVDTATIVDGAVTSDKLADGARSNRDILTKSAAYTLLATDDMLFVNANSAAFTVTLGAYDNGAVFTIQKSDSSFNAINIGPGVAMLSTEGEQVTIMQDGGGFSIVDRIIPGPAETYTMTIGGSTTDPTKATTTQVDEAVWYRKGKNIELTYQYEASVGTGAADGSGTYEFHLPTGLTLDTGVRTSTVTTIVGHGYGHSAGSAYISSIHMVAGSSTLFEIRAHDGAGNVTVGSAFHGLTKAATAMSFNVTMPITGWEG